jgi:hypothetical protein
MVLGRMVLSSNFLLYQHRWTRSCAHRWERDIGIHPADTQHNQDMEVKLSFFYVVQNLGKGEIKEIIYKKFTNDRLECNLAFTPN